MRQSESQVARTPITPFYFSHRVARDKRLLSPKIMCLSGTLTPKWLIWVVRAAKFGVHSSSSKKRCRKAFLTVLIKPNASLPPSRRDRLFRRCVNRTFALALTWPCSTITTGRPMPFSRARVESGLGGGQFLAWKGGWWADWLQDDRIRATVLGHQCILGQKLRWRR